jgi:hypothetical protein
MGFDRPKAILDSGKFGECLCSRRLKPSLSSRLRKRNRRAARSSSTLLSVVLFCANPPNIRDWEKHSSAPRPENEPRGIRDAIADGTIVLASLKLPRLSSRQDSVYGGAQSFRGQGLEQIVDGVDLEGSNSVLVVDRCEANVRHREVRLGRQCACDIEFIATSTRFQSTS